MAKSDGIPLPSTSTTKRSKAGSTISSTTKKLKKISSTSSLGSDSSSGSLSKSSSTKTKKLVGLVVKYTRDIVWPRKQTPMSRWIRIGFLFTGCVLLILMIILALNDDDQAKSAQQQNQQGQQASSIEASLQQPQSHQQEQYPPGHGASRVSDSRLIEAFDDTGASLSLPSSAPSTSKRKAIRQRLAMEAEKVKHALGDIKDKMKRKPREAGEAAKPPLEKPMIRTSRIDSSRLLTSIGDWKNRGGEFSTIWALKNVCFNSTLQKFVIHGDDLKDLPSSVAHDVDLVYEIPSFNSRIPDDPAKTGYTWVNDVTILCRGNCDLSRKMPAFYFHTLPLWSLLHLLYETSRHKVPALRILSDKPGELDVTGQEHEFLDMLGKSIDQPFLPQSLFDVSLGNVCFQRLFSYGSDYFGLVRTPEDMIPLRKHVVDRGTTDIANHCRDLTEKTAYMVVDYERRPMILNRLDVLKAIKSVLGEDFHVKTVDISDAQLLPRMKIMNAASFVVLVNGMRSSGDIAWLPRESHVVEILPFDIYDIDYMRQSKSLGLVYHSYEEHNATQYEEYLGKNAVLRKQYIESGGSCWNDLGCRKLLYNNIPIYVSIDSFIDVLKISKQSWMQTCHNEAMDGKPDQGPRV